MSARSQVPQSAAAAAFMSVGLSMPVAPPGPAYNLPQRGMHLMESKMKFQEQINITLYLKCI